MKYELLHLSCRGLAGAPAISMHPAEPGFATWPNGGLDSAVKTENGLKLTC